MPKWKIFLFWFALMAWHLGSAIFLVTKGRESELASRDNSSFWMFYMLLWIFCLYSEEELGRPKEAGCGYVLYSLAWSFLVGITGLGVKLLAWVLLRVIFGIEVRFIWGEVFTVVYATVCLVIPFWLKRHSVKTQEII